MSEHLVVPDERSGIELDEFLCLQFPLLSKGHLRTFIRSGAVVVNGARVLPSWRLREGQVVSIDIPDDFEPKTPVAPRTPLRILAEQDEWLAVDKPAGLAVEPERWDRDAACVSGGLLELSLARSRDDKSNVVAGAVQVTDAEVERGDADTTLDRRLRAVHRIDKDTTGILLVAKSIEAERYLRRCFQTGLVSKEYLALVEGEFRPAEGEDEWIDAPISPDRRRVGRMLIRTGGKPSRTRVRVVQSFRGFTLVKCYPETGRTHQIRVHLAHAGFPLVIDPLYGRRSELMLSEVKRKYRPKKGQTERPLMDRLTLHAATLEFPFRAGASLPDIENDPTQRIESALPADYERALRQLAKVRAH
ncbi:MAG: 23S rRNA pseudouridine1911/1915/1917 synthase [Planctomycetota bacterium]|jgi:23S rRNA pseudouridine1911/1915/1917 synthase